MYAIQRMLILCMLSLLCMSMGFPTILTSGNKAANAKSARSERVNCSQSRETRLRTTTQPERSQKAETGSDCTTESAATTVSVPVHHPVNLVAFWSVKAGVFLTRHFAASYAPAMYRGIFYWSVRKYI